MPTTPNRGLAYPALTDTPDVPYWLQQLATGADTAWPFRVEFGKSTVSANAGAHASVVVASSAAFTATPVIVITPASGRLNPAVEAQNLTGFTAGFDNWTAGNSGSVAFHWVAIGL